mgnify:CR=1 FL=1
MVMTVWILAYGNNVAAGRCDPYAGTCDKASSEG